MTALRAATFAALALFAALHWAGMLEPAPVLPLAAAIAIALIAAPALHRVAPASRPRRIAFGAGVAAAGAVATLVLAGVPLRLLWPGGWDELWLELGAGIEALPGTRIPYGGADEWVRSAITAGGVALVLLAAALASGPRPRLLAAAAVLGVLWGVPVVEQDPALEYLDGTLFALLAAALLWGERLARHEMALAAALLVVASGAGLAVAPRVDADRAWLDYEGLARDLDLRNTSTFRWDHRYGPLDWKRDGREVLRVKARRSAYWKAASLEDFDGVSWRRAAIDRVADYDTEIGRDAWREELRVTIRGLRSREVLGAGTTLRVLGSPRGVAESTPGTFRTISRPLRRDDSYRADVYVARPSVAAMRGAGEIYPDFLRPQLRVQLPRMLAGGRLEPASPTDRQGRVDMDHLAVQIPSFGEDELIVTARRYGFQADGAEVLRASPYRRAFELAQRLKAGSATPYEFVRRVQSRVRRGATYTEDPPPARVPLDAFLFGAREGYCQQFSGAMALLLRLGGVPARVATGFTPGTYDARRKEYVVRDMDAHSWVEVYFPGLGWVTFDPTPAAAPVRGREDESSPTSAAPGDTRADEGAGRGEASASAPAAGDAPSEGQGRPWIAAVLLAGIALLLLGAAWVQRRRAGAGAPRDLPSEVEELRRALVLTGRMAGEGTTLHAVERALGHGPASAYVRALRVGRFGPPGTTAAAPPGGRAALRRELGAGLGLPGRLRALVALPPRRGEPRIR